MSKNFKIIGLFVKMRLQNILISQNGFTATRKLESFS